MKRIFLVSFIITTFVWSIIPQLIMANDLDGTIRRVRTGDTPSHPYLFSDTNIDVDSLGRKGFNLVQLAELEIPVPAFLIIGSDVDRSELTRDKIEARVSNYFEEKSGMTFGKYDPFLSIPFLVSVRSSPSISMPGILDTVLNVGMNKEVVELLIQNNLPRFAWETYCRFLRSFGTTVFGIDKEAFGQIPEAQDAETFEKLASEWENVITKRGYEVPQDPIEQLLMAIEAVYDSWNSNLARTYREERDISDEEGLAIIIQEMKFGNLNTKSGTFVLFTRDPVTGEKNTVGEYLPMRQGEDLVGGGITPLSLEESGLSWGYLHALKEELSKKIETHFKEMQEIEGIKQAGRIYILQTRDGVRTARAAVKIAFDLVSEGTATKEEVLSRLNLDELRLELPRTNIYLQTLLKWQRELEGIEEDLGDILMSELFEKIDEYGEERVIREFSKMRWETFEEVINAVDTLLNYIPNLLETHSEVVTAFFVSIVSDLRSGLIEMPEWRSVSSWRVVTGVTAEDIIEDEVLYFKTWKIRDDLIKTILNKEIPSYLIALMDTFINMLPGEISIARLRQALREGQIIHKKIKEEEKERRRYMAGGTGFYAHDGEWVPGIGETGTGPPSYEPVPSERISAQLYREIKDMLSVFFYTPSETLADGPLKYVNSWISYWKAKINREEMGLLTKLKERLISLFGKKKVTDLDSNIIEVIESIPKLLSQRAYKAAISLTQIRQRLNEEIISNENIFMYDRVATYMLDQYLEALECGRYAGAILDEIAEVEEIELTKVIELFNGMIESAIVSRHWLSEIEIPSITKESLEIKPKKVLSELTDQLNEAISLLVGRDCIFREMVVQKFVNNVELLSEAMTKLRLANEEAVIDYITSSNVKNTILMLMEELIQRLNDFLTEKYPWEFEEAGKVIDMILSLGEIESPETLSMDEFNQDIARESTGLPIVGSFEWEGKKIMVLAKEMEGKIRLVYVISKNSVDILEPREEEVILSGRTNGIDEMVFGPVRIISDPTDTGSLDKISQGDILVAPYAERNLTIILSKISALITDIGGLTNHLSISATEKEIPAILGTKNAIKYLKDGMYIWFDGINGKVNIARYRFKPGDVGFIIEH